jgi:hypothetical protein
MFLSQSVYVLEPLQVSNQFKEFKGRPAEQADYFFQDKNRLGTRAESLSSSLAALPYLLKLLQLLELLELRVYS